MNLTTHLECPERIATGLATGRFSREGGTVRDASGHIVTLLREAGSSPSRACDLVSGGQMGKLLNFVSPALSILNLGATVGFGMATLHKLGRIEGKLDRLAEKFDRVQWVVELNYAHTLEVLRGTNTICTMMERRVLSDLQAAADLAVNAQWLEPNSAHRVSRLENALLLATQQACYLRAHVLEELPRATGQLLERKIARPSNPFRDLRGEQFKNAIVQLNWFRQSCLAASLKAQIQAEIGGLSEARHSLQSDCEQFEAALRNCALSYFRTKTFHTYDYLVHRYWLDKIPFSRVVDLASRYDPTIPNADALIELLKGNDYHDKHPAHEPPRDWHEDLMPPLGAVFELLECATADLDRLRGVADEFALAHDSKLTLQEYREKTRVDDVPDEGLGRLVYLEISPTPKD